MNVIGLDLGTTTLSAVVIDGLSGHVLNVLVAENRSWLPSRNEWSKEQDAAWILNRAVEIIQSLIDQYGPISAVGLTGQMHGMVYLDEQGLAVSPLYTWQDQRGQQIWQDGLTYVQYLGTKRNSHLATGYAAVTHRYNLDHQLVPDSARSFTSIHGYIGMRLCHRKKPLVHASDAASFGMFDLKNKKFSRENLAAAGMDVDFFPEVSAGIAQLGHMECGIPVAVAIGDNQASFLGSAAWPKQSILLNIGTGGQVSVCSDHLPMHPDIEARPYLQDCNLLVGSTLCGGRAYALLEQFFRSCCSLSGNTVPSFYAYMNQVAERALVLPDLPHVYPAFTGSRTNPEDLASISRLSPENFSPEHLIAGFLHGIAEELNGLYQKIAPSLDQQPDYLIGSGNGLRKNQALQKLLARNFNLPLYMPAHQEEAAVGASLYALTAAGLKASINEAQLLIEYEKPVISR